MPVRSGWAAPNGCLRVFAGIIERTGRVSASLPTSAGKRLAVDAADLATGVKLGVSVSVNGVCLTVARCAGATLEFDVISETLRRTTLGDLTAGRRVNLERSLCAGDRIDGHFVQGHVDGTAVVAEVRNAAADWIVWLRPDENLLPYLVPKGSVAIDGVSLTIAEADARRFSVALIPTTLERTMLGELRAGDRVNIESDVIARIVVHRLGAYSRPGGVTRDMLTQAGYTE